MSQHSLRRVWWLLASSFDSIEACDGVDIDSGLMGVDGSLTTACEARRAYENSSRRIDRTHHTIMRSFPQLMCLALVQVSEKSLNV